MKPTSRAKASRDTLIIVSSRALGVIIQLYSLIILTRVFSLSDMGLFSLFYAATGIARALGPLGMDQASLKLLSVSDVQSTSEGAVSRILTSGLFMCAIFCLFIISIGAFLAFFDIFPHAFGLAEQIISICSAAGFICTSLVVGQLRGLGVNVSGQILDSFVLNLIFLVSIVLYDYSGLLTLNSAMFAMALSVWITFAMMLALQFRALSNLHRPSSEHFAVADVKLLIVEGWKIFEAHIATVATHYAPIFLAGAIAGPHTVALLDVAQRFGAVATILTASVGASYNAVFARFYAERRFAELRRAVFDAGCIAGAPAALYAAFLFGSGHILVGRFLPEAYLAAVPAMAIIALASTINATFGPVSNLYLMSGRAPLVRLFAIISLFTVIMGCIILEPIWGLVGISTSIAASKLVRDMGLAIAFAFSKSLRSLV